MIYLPNGNMRGFSGDSETMVVPLHKTGVIVGDWDSRNLLLTAKRSKDDTDESAVFQKMTGSGITVTGKKAYVEIVPYDTVDEEDVLLYLDIRGEVRTDGTRDTFASWEFFLEKPVTKHTDATIPIYTTTPAQFADEVYYTPTITGLTGGGDTNLDGLATVGLDDGRMQKIIVDGSESTYRGTTGSASESSPDVILSDDQPSGYYWQLVSTSVVSWGSITGTLSFQTDLQSALDTKRTYDNSDFNFILEGDSIFQGVTSGGATAGNYLQDVIGSFSYFAGRATITDYANAGDQISSVISNYSSQTYTKRPSANGGKRAIYCILIGTNDSTSDATIATNVASLLTHVATAKTDGFEVWVCTLLPRGASGAINQWDGFNRRLKASNVPDKIIDLNAIFRDATTTDWTSDNLHPNNVGYLRIADAINAAAWSDRRLAETNFGSLAKQNSDAVAITGGAISGANITTSGNLGVTRSGPATLGSYDNTSASSRQWEFGHDAAAVGNLPAGSFKFNYYNGSSWEFSYSGFRPGGGIIGTAVTIPPVTVANLIATPATNTFATVNDASAFTAGSTVAGGGSVKCMVQYNGAAWKMVLQLY